jgi:GNAT superfamily N-acetyltransferase
LPIPPITPLSTAHDRSDFSCGHVALDQYLQKTANQDIKRKVAAVFVLSETDNHRVQAYYTLSATILQLNQLPENLKKQLPRYPALPATLIGRLAVDQSAKGKGIGKFMLMDALKKAWQHSQEIASMAVVVDAIDEQAVAFYLHYHFFRIENSSTLYLPMKEIESLFK